MSESVDLKQTVEDVISSYEKRIESINSIFDTTDVIFNGFQESMLDTKEEREKINSQLRDILAKNEHLRKKDFDNMIKGILLAQDELEKEVRNLLKDYFIDQRTMTQSLRENLGKFRESITKGEAERVKEFQRLIKNILAQQEKRKEEIITKLKAFQKEQGDLAIELKALLSKGDNLRIKDFKSMLNEFKAQRDKRIELQKKRKKEVAQMLGSFKKARQKFRLSPPKGG